MTDSTQKTESTLAPNLANSDLLTISVQEFGPIAQATIDIRPLTIFVGQSNTGKTYFSKLIYGFHKALAGFPKIPLKCMPYDLYTTRQPLESLLTQIKANPKLENGQNTIRDLLFQSFRRTRRYKNNNLLAELESYFSTNSILTTRRFNSSETNFKIEASCNESSKQLWNISIQSEDSKPSLEIKFNRYGIDLAGTAYNQLVSKIEDNTDLTYLINIAQHREWFSYQLANYILNLAYPDSCDFQDSYFLPANRGGIIENQKFVADAWLAQIPDLGLRNLPQLQPLPRVSVDLFRAMLMVESGPETIDSKSRLNGGGPIEGIAKFMEDKLIRGKLLTIATSKTSYPTIRYIPVHMEQPLKLDDASSMVSELAPVILFTRSHLKPFDLLVIEEPEAHLHPGALPLVAQCLAKLIRNNVRVLISTHSDWLLKALRNLILEGDLMQLGDLDERGLNDGYLLRQEVGAWEFFKSDELNGTTVKEIVFDEVDGIEPLEIDQIADSLYNESVSIRNRKSGLV